MKFSGKMLLMIVSEVTKNLGFTLSLGDISFRKTTWEFKLTSQPF